MTLSARSVKNICRLTELRRGRLQHLQQEYIQLTLLAEGEQAKVVQAEANYATTQEEMGQKELSGPLDVVEMLSRRRYLTQLQATLLLAEAQLAAVLRQVDQARRDLESMQAEIRALERLGERRQNSLSEDLRQREYGASDDLALARRFFRDTVAHG